MKTYSVYNRSHLMMLMIKIIICLALLLTMGGKISIRAQPAVPDSTKYWKLNTEGDHFWEPNCPTSPMVLDGYTLWLLRQKFTIEAYQTIVNGEYNLNDKNFNKYQITNYMPLVGKGDFNSMIGTQYSKIDFISNNDYNLNKSLQQLWIWTAWQYKFKRWDLSITTENFFKGDESTLYKYTGNETSVLAYAGYAFNNKWALILLATYNDKQMNKKAVKTMLGGVQARYQPSPKLKLLFGAPAIFAMEWTALPQTDVGMEFMITMESLCYVRQRLSNNVSCSVQFANTLNYTSETFFNNTTLSTKDNGVVTYNNVTYYQPKLFGELNFKLWKDVGFSVGAGYNFSNKAKLYNNNDKVYSSLKSKDNFFLNCSLQIIRLK